MGREDNGFAAEWIEKAGWEREEDK